MERVYEINTRQSRGLTAIILRHMFRERMLGKNRELLSSGVEVENWHERPNVSPNWPGLKRMRGRPSMNRRVNITAER